MPPAGFLDEKTMEESQLMNFQTAFGYGSEDVQLIIESMAMSGKEPTYCMGDDTPLAVLSEKPHLIYNYFKQRFAQVTNPAIDPLREGLVMGVEMFIGAKGNIFSTDLSNEGRQLKLKSPVLSEKDLVNLEQTEFLKPSKHQMMVKPDQSLKEAIQELCASVEKEVRAGSQCVVLSDRFDASELSGTVVVDAAKNEDEILCHRAKRVQTSKSSRNLSSFLPLSQEPKKMYLIYIYVYSHTCAYNYRRNKHSCSSSDGGCSSPPDCRGYPHEHINSRRHSSMLQYTSLCYPDWLWSLCDLPVSCPRNLPSLAGMTESPVIMLLRVGCCTCLNFNSLGSLPVDVCFAYFSDKQANPDSHPARENRECLNCTIPGELQKGRECRS